MNGVDAVFHCAALADLWRRNEQDYIDVNVAGTRAVATAAMKRGAQLVHVSSYTTLIGGARREPKPLDERVERPVGDLLGPYPQSKRLAELEVYKAFRAGLDACIVMPSSPIGPGDHHLTPPKSDDPRFSRRALCPLCWSVRSTSSTHALSRKARWRLWTAGARGNAIS